MPDWEKRWAEVRENMSADRESTELSDEDNPDEKSWEERWNEVRKHMAASADGERPGPY